MATIITIVRSGGAVGFQPSSPTVPKGTTVVFRNEDPQEQHLITLAGKDANFWFRYPLAPFMAGRPADVSDEVLFNNAGQVKFECSMHSGETGTITVQ